MTLKSNTLHSIAPMPTASGMQVSRAVGSHTARPGYGLEVNAGVTSTGRKGQQGARQWRRGELLNQ